MTRTNPTDPEGVKILAHWAKRTPGAVRGKKVRGGISITVEYHPLFDWLQRWPGHRRDMDECRSVTFKYVMNELDDIETESGEDYPWLHALSDDAWAWYQASGDTSPGYYTPPRETRRNPARRSILSHADIAGERNTRFHNLEQKAREDGLRWGWEHDFDENHFLTLRRPDGTRIEVATLSGPWLEVQYSLEADEALHGLLLNWYQGHSKRSNEGGR